MKGCEIGFGFDLMLCVVGWGQLIDDVIFSLYKTLQRSQAQTVEQRSSSVLESEEKKEISKRGEEKRKEIAMAGISMKSCMCLVVFAVFLGISGFAAVDGAGECGKSTTPDREAFKLAPCASAAQDQNAAVSSQCCAQVKKLGQNPACLCAVMLSNTAKSSGVKPEVAMAIPKRCNLADRPVGYKCGDYTLP
ncbi:unnamed protein product [Linum tenue]|uniref:Bifunctional inhibitor/plant lipid transfer protein/seed storage helical domain-containing protein n=1 Tax=Linum tenue TaxID=586396 RepID=A0AAV0MA58_9ROSI|nr:unnamed protein product [Linum tenue]